DRLAARRIVHARERGFAWLWHPADQSLKRNARLRTRNAHDRNCRRRAARRQRENGGTIRHATGVPIPKFVRSFGTLSCELRNQRDPSKYIILVRFLALKFL